MAMKFVSLFSGAMGLDLGLERAGFETAVCVENDPEAVSTIRLNRPNLPIFDTDIGNVTGEKILSETKLPKNEVRMVAGGPPCQSFSVFGNRLGIKDARGQLIFEFQRIIDELKPSVFIMENVRGLLSMSIVPRSKMKAGSGTVGPDLMEKGSLIKLVFKKFNEIGYNVDCFVVNSANYGAPQIRERVLLIGNRHGLVTDFPQPTHSNRPKDGLKPFKTLGDAIGPGSGFKDTHIEVMDFSPRKLKYLKIVPPGGNWRSMPVEIQKESMGKSWYLKGGRSAYWRKLSFDFPSPTIVTMPNHAGTSMCHPTDLRAISVGEAAAIQEFPNSWKFSGTTASKFRQIGNAVPVRLGEVASGVLKGLINRINNGERAQLKNPGNRVVHIRPHVRTRTFWRNGRAYAGNHSYYESDDKQKELMEFK